jgi:hypothetical protein
MALKELASVMLALDELALTKAVAAGSLIEVKTALKAYPSSATGAH